MVVRFQKYHSNIQWIFAVREHAEVLKVLDGQLCQAVTVTDKEINAPLDGHRNCAARRSLTAAELGQLNDAVPPAGTYSKNELITYAIQDQGSEFCFRFRGVVELVDQAYRILNSTIKEVCNRGETDSLLLDRRVDFVVSLPNGINLNSYYGYAALPPRSLCFLTRRRGPIAPSFASSWMSFFAVFLILAPVAAVTTLVLSVHLQRYQSDVPMKSDLILFFFSTYLWQSPAPLKKSSLASVRVVSAIWMFGMFFLVQFTQTNITASRNVPEQSPQVRHLEELASRLDDGRLSLCMHFVCADIIRKIGGQCVTPHFY
ncbi:hypothetical protein MTO96_040961 [Rhipicephalus appendiculatus]